MKHFHREKQNLVENNDSKSTLLRDKNCETEIKYLIKKI